MRISPPTRAPRPSEQGYILVSVMFMLAILMITMAIAAPRIAKSIQRDRELETMHRGKQYARAVKLYYKQFGSYPPNVDALVKTNEIRYLRKRYLDPITGKDDWKPVQYGMQKTQPTGFFGQPIGGMGLGGAGMTGTPGIGGIPSPAAGMTFGGSSPGTGAFGSSTISSSTGSFGSSTIGSSTIGSTDTSSGDGGSTTSGATGANAGTPGSSPSSSAFGSQPGQTFGGGGMGIMGFSPGSPKESILVFRKKKHYNEWEFLYEPLTDTMMGGGNIGTIGTPIGGNSNGSTIGSGSTIGTGSTIGSGSTTDPTTPTTTPPQQ